MEGMPIVIDEEARKHGVSDDDMLHAFRNPVDTYYQDDGRTMFVGSSHSGAPLEVGWVVDDETGDIVIIHAMPARPKFLR